MRVVEYPVSVRRDKVVFPEIEVLESLGRPVGRNAPAGTQLAILGTKTARQVKSVIEWADLCAHDRCTIVGCFGFEKHEFRIDREFKGLAVYFEDDLAAIQFRLVWGSYYEWDQPTIVADDSFYEDMIATVLH